jgi:hypothetical protein
LLAAGYGPRVLVARSSKGGLDVFAEHDSSEAVSRDKIQSILKRNGLPAAATIDLSSRRGAKATDADSPSTAHKDMMLYHALPVRIETPKGGVRSGPGWQTTMPADYGFIDNVPAADNDNLDCYVGPDPESSNVYVVDQYKLDGKSWDEHKVMLAYPTQEAAVADYMAGHHKSDRVFAAVTAFTMPHFRKWLSHHDMTQPCDPSVEVRPWA